MAAVSPATSSGGVTVHVEALPCPALPVGDGTCRWEGYNSQAAVTVSSPGGALMTVQTDGQSGYARIAVVRFQQDDARPGVIIESQSGGSDGNMTAQLLLPTGDSFRAVPVNGHHGPQLQGELADYPQDFSGDGIVDLKLADGAFAYVFGCNACTPRPPQLFAVKDGKVVDESRDPALRSVFAADMRRLQPICLSKAPDRNGVCAAYVADAARAGQFKAAWGAMLKHYEPRGELWEPCHVPVSVSTGYRCPEGQVSHFRNFPVSLGAFLKRTGYLPS